jgi:tRNA(His) 5'-end guanylyltransferase
MGAGTRQGPDRLLIVNGADEISFVVREGDRQFHGAAERVENFTPALRVKQFRVPPNEVHIAEGCFYGCFCRVLFVTR